jgi:hypothetical protein
MSYNKLIGFGCSATYGSELLNPNLENSWDGQKENIKYRESKVWLGVLAKRLGLEVDNYAQPSCSNYAIQEKFAEWFNSRDKQQSVIVLIGWSGHQRLSWWHETNSHQLSNYHQGDQNMKQVLQSEGKRLNKNFLADGEHPNELGHEYYVEMLYSWIKAKNII